MDNTPEKIITSTGADATIPAAYPGDIGTIVETKAQADLGRSKILRYFVLFVSLGGLALVWAMLTGFSRLSNTVQTANNDHGITEVHTTEIQKLRDDVDTLKDGETAILSTIKDNNSHSQQSLDQILTKLGELQGKSDMRDRDAGAK